MYCLACHLILRKLSHDGRRDCFQIWVIAERHLATRYALHQLRVRALPIIFIDDHVAQEMIHALVDSQASVTRNLEIAYAELLRLLSPLLTCYNAFILRQVNLVADEDALAVRLDYLIVVLNPLVELFK